MAIYTAIGRRQVNTMRSETGAVGRDKQRAYPGRGAQASLSAGFMAGHLSATVRQRQVSARRTERRHVTPLLYEGSTPPLPRPGRVGPACRLARRAATAAYVQSVQGDGARCHQAADGAESTRAWPPPPPRGQRSHAPAVTAATQPLNGRHERHRGRHPATQTAVTAAAQGQLSHRGSCHTGQLSHRGNCHTGATVTQGQLSHRGSCHTGAAVTQGQLSHRGNCHTGAAVTQGKRGCHTGSAVTQRQLSHRGRCHTGQLSHRGNCNTEAAVTQGKLSHRGSCHIGEAGLSHRGSCHKEQLSHRGSCHTVATVTQGQLSHRDSCHTGAAVTRGQLSHGGSCHTGAPVTQERLCWSGAVLSRSDTLDGYERMVCKIMPDSRGTGSGVATVHLPIATVPSPSHIAGALCVA